MDNTRIEFEDQSQEVQKELSLKELLGIFVQNWPLFLLLLVFVNLAGMIYYNFSNPYISKSSIIVSDIQNSQLQLFAQGLGAATTLKTNEAKKPNSVVNKRLELLSTAEFYDSLINLILNATKDQLTLSELKGLNFLKTELFKNKTSFSEDEKLSLFRTLESMISFKVKTDFEIETAVAHDKKEVALFLSNIVSRRVLQILKAKEAEEIQTIETFLSVEKKNVEAELNDLNLKMAVFVDKPENLISISSKDKVGDYLAELMMRKSETLLKISENNKIIQSLKSYAGVSGANRRESQLYGNGGKVQALALENDLLRAKLGQIQTAIDSMTLKAKNMPYMAQMYDDLKKKSDQNFQKSKNLSESLSKVEALKLASVSKYEIYEKARYDKVNPHISLSIILFAGALISQILGSLIIYLRAIWDTNLITAQATRNIVVVDSHSLDPRVIIENSKIRFRLRNSSMNDNDPELGQNKKIGFNFNFKDVKSSSKKESAAVTEIVEQSTSAKIVDSTQSQAGDGLG